MIKTIILASGCFWGTEYYMKKHPAVVKTEPGYIGGKTDNPTYEQVCTGTTGHAEAVKVDYDTEKGNISDILKYFFETHIFDQEGGIGPDIGSQYRSEIFYFDNEQKQTAEKLIQILKNKGYKVTTKLTPASKFYPAELYHHNYYFHKGSTPYCHFYTKIF